MSPLPIKYVVNTHQHSDHTGSNAEFLKTAEILTKAQVKVFRDKMQTSNDRMSAFITSGGRKPDIAARVKVDDLDWPFPAGGLDGLYDEWAPR